jgi:hypothetical protein
MRSSMFLTLVLLPVLYEWSEWRPGKQVRHVAPAKAETWNSVHLAGAGKKKSLNSGNRGTNPDKP